MGRGRAPCCQKVGLNKGSWTPEEDIGLISYIHKHGHSNWRALPKQAGLLRCGKSCRLRWTNYLRPDIKRGNFTKEEESTIISLHQSLGNKWSKIASCLPGRTDNEIKNVWNTHLKKRLKHHVDLTKSMPKTTAHPDYPPSSSSSSTTTTTTTEGAVVLSLDKIEITIEAQVDLWDVLIDPDLWSDVTIFNQTNDQTIEADAGDDGRLYERQNWLAYLEEELGLFDSRGNAKEMEGADSMVPSTSPS